jgi:hypothetical protein
MIPGAVPDAMKPTSIKRIEKYLALGRIRGVGPIYAKQHGEVKDCQEG